MFKYRSGEPFYVTQDSEIPEPLPERSELLEEFDPEAWWMIADDKRYLLDDETLALIEQFEKECR